VLKSLCRRNDPELALHRTLHQLSRYQKTVDLVRAFENAVDARVTISLLRRIVGRVSVATEDLDHFIDDVIEGLTARDLVDRRFDRVLLDRLQLLRIVRTVPDKRVDHT